MDLLGPIDPERIINMPLPFIMDLLKAKIRLEQSKSNAQKAAEALKTAVGKGQL
jgi:hypothetical protein